jgi:lysophospholipase L1-like esterase
MKHALALLCLSAALLTGERAAAADSAEIDCPKTNQFAGLGTTLPMTAAALRRGDELVVVAIGSSSTSGVGATDRAHAYPARLENELRRRWPGKRVHVINKGIGGEEAGQMIARFERDVLSQNPDLVIWQAGTNMMLRNGNKETLLPLLRAGVQTLKSKHIDVVLMDPQYAPKVTDVPVHREFVATIAQVAEEQRIGLFHRFALMRDWIDTDAFAVNDVISPDKLHMNNVSYTCVARGLAAGIADAVRATPVPMAVQHGAISQR